MTLQRIARNSFLVLGRAGLDLYADPPGTQTEHAQQFSAALGGSAANIAVAIVKLEGAAALATCVSDDSVGRYTLNELRRYGVNADHVRAVGGEARNSLAVVETRSENCQSVIYRNSAADFHFARADAETIAYGRFGAMIVTGTCLAMEPSREAVFFAIDRARAAGVPVILDVDYRPYSWPSAEEAGMTCRQAAAQCDIVIGNDEEFAVMANGGGLALAQEMASDAAKIAVYKMGGKGSVTFAGRERFATGIFAVEPLKPTGAGDAFMGGFVTGLAKGLDLKASVIRGSAAAAIVVTKVGCAPAAPTSAELDEFLRRRNTDALEQ